MNTPLLNAAGIARCVFLAAVAVPGALFAIGQARYVEFTATPGAFAIVRGGSAAICVDPSDYPGVLRAAKDLGVDIARVTGKTPSVREDTSEPRGKAIIIGTVGHSRLIDGLIRDGRLDVKPIAGKWESFVIQASSNTLIIAGSDQRGAIYGAYDVSEQIGVSPWYWWADVPVQHQDNLFVKAGRFVQGPPAVKYRGIFLNDEAPALTGWVHEKFGNYNHEFYEKVFELLLRMKGNYLWPAMWNNAFYEDDPLNGETADRYGVVMGTTHHEPMLRAQQEWKRHAKGPWDYTKNAEFLREFWAGGVERARRFETIVTVGMRGDGDMPMARGDANVALLEQIVADQRKIIAGKVNPNVTAVPQLWALYKEVQEYYEKGMRVPDDVTLLWSDDNWGNIRRLPTPDERGRSGGAGIYYHFDYVGGPRNYKWINTNQISKVQEQMNLAWNYGADRIWIVNVGDLKPMEFPTEFFLHMAWNPQRWSHDAVPEYTRLWAEREFGSGHAAEIADLVSTYSKLVARRKPELLEPSTFSVVDYQEADRVLAEYRSLVASAERVSNELPAVARPAFFELVLHPAKAAAQVTELYIAVSKNRLYAAQGRATANDEAARARAVFRADAELSDDYNHKLLNGKWDHMMDQTHIGYTYWQQPPENVMPDVTEIDVPAAASMGVAVEGSLSVKDGLTLPPIDVYNRQRRYIEVFNRGRAPFTFSARASAPWIVLSETAGPVDKQRRVWVAVDWSKAPQDRTEGFVQVNGPGLASPVEVKVAAVNPKEPSRETLDGFVESDGYVSIEAEHYSRKTAAGDVAWEKLADYGRTLSAMTVFPVTAKSILPPNDSPCLEYRMYLFDAGKVSVEAIIAPTLNFVPGRGLRYAISFDDQPPQVIDALEHNSLRDWETTVKDSVRKALSEHTLENPGYHTLKFRMVDPGVVLEKLVVNLGGVKPSYLGPPESYRGAKRPVNAGLR